MLGDVCGKGARAAALTGLLRYSTRTAAMQGSRPSAVLRQVNDVLRRDASTGSDTTFATMVFARLRPRPDALEVSFAVGGHPRPYVLRADGRVETPGKDGTLLGVLADAEFNDAKVVLGPGDTFVVMTDGVLEARDAQGVELADHLPRVLEAVTDAPAAAIVGAVERVALDWQGGTPRDDIAVVALRVPPR
jgi:sigma-B regulation protein RsbU (phosphoserine phosphatase)